MSYSDESEGLVHKLFWHYNHEFAADRAVRIVMEVNIAKKRQPQLGGMRENVPQEGGCADRKISAAADRGKNRF